MSSSGLMIVDLQKDLCEGGAIAVRGARTVVPKCNGLIHRARLAGAKIMATRLWHPEHHCSFAEQGGPWPVHCVAGTHGAEFHEGLMLPDDLLIINKGTGELMEELSALAIPGLLQHLRKLRISRLVLCGVASEHAIRATALDAIKGGLEVVVAADACAGVNVRPGDDQLAMMELNAAGATICPSTAVTF